MEDLMPLYTIFTVLWELCKAAIQIAPINTVVREGDNSVLFCSFTTPVNDVTGRQWVKYGMPTVYFNAQGRTSDAPAQLSLGDNYNLVVTNASRQVAALYECKENSYNKKSAWIIYISPNLQLTFGAEYLTAKCTSETGGLGLSWQPTLTLWKGNQTASSQDFQESFYIRAISHTYNINDLSDGDVIMCRMSYNDSSPPFMTDQDDTIPQEDTITQTLRKPYNMKITKILSEPLVAIGDLLECSCSALPDAVTYKWLDVEGIVVGNYSLLTMTSNMTRHNVSCVATNILGKNTISANKASDESQVSKVTETNNNNPKDNTNNDNNVQNGNNDELQVDLGAVRRSEANHHVLSTLGILLYSTLQLLA